MRKSDLIDPKDVLPLVLANSQIDVSLRRFKAWFKHARIPGKYWDGRKWWIRRESWERMVRKDDWTWIGTAASAYYEYERRLKESRQQGKYQNPKMVRGLLRPRCSVTIFRVGRPAYKGMGRVGQVISGGLPRKFPITRIEIGQPLCRLGKATVLSQGQFVHWVRRHAGSGS